MKILTVIGGIGTGGAEYMVYELIKHQNDPRFEMSVLCHNGRNHGRLEQETEKLCPVQYLACQGRVGIKNILSVMRCMTAAHPDVIHAHMGSAVYAIPWGILHHKPVIITVHTEPREAFRRKSERLIRFGLKKRIVTLVAVSKENCKKVKEYFNISNDQCVYVNNGVDGARFYRKGHSDFSFINVARQDENKNQVLLLKAFRRIHALEPKTKLYLIGDGPCHGELLELKHQWGLDDAVFLPGMTEKPEEYYALADTYVQSSHREAMPLSILEAISAGLPVISTDVGGIRDVVNGNGILVQDHDEEAFYDAMKYILTSSAAEREDMSRRSQEIAQGYTAERMAEEYGKVYLASANRRGLNRG